MEIFLDLSLQQECEVNMVFILFHQVSVMLCTEMWSVFFPSLCYCFAFKLQNKCQMSKITGENIFESYSCLILVGFTH